MTTEESGWISIDYTNHRGERGTRVIKPHRVWFGSTVWHAREQWLIEAIDRDRKELRNFSLQNIHGWHVDAHETPSGPIRTGIYRHFKGGFYYVISTLRHSETNEEMVSYRALHGNFDLWVRPREMFESVVTAPDGEKLKRFQFVSAL
jgi:predicted DNA-binding transcriptional regulator YafY